MSTDEINRANRTNDINRYQSMDFIVGYQINLSNNRDCKCEICSSLMGKYPKSFIWSGWHDDCKCFLTPILQDPDEFDKQELEELKAAIRGTEYKKEQSKDVIQILPKNFIYWYMVNVQKMLDDNVFPDFVVNNIDLIKESVHVYSKMINSNGNNNY